MVPDIQLRLLDVKFPTFNITYCTSGSRCYVLFSYTSGSQHLMLLIARRVPNVIFFFPTRRVPDI